MYKFFVYAALAAWCVAGGLLLMDILAATFKFAG
jgi:hypothetical protein